MRVLGVIPARYGSTRFPGKPLVQIAGKPLLQWVVEGARSAKRISEILIATDDIRIAELGQQLGVRVVMTDSNLPSGSDRVWAAVEKENCDLALNIQGDEPLIKGEPLDQLISCFDENSQVEMATLGRKMTDEALATDTTAKIVLNKYGQAIYFSRFAIPYSRGSGDATQYSCLKHVGIYAYRKSFLKLFCQQPPTEIEIAEGLEQLRALYLGAKIQVVHTDYESWGVDTPADVLIVEKKLKGIS